MKSSTTSRRLILLSVAGFDPSGGAGILLDLKVFDYFNFYGLAVITSLTVQNTQGVKSFQPLPPDILWQQYQTLKEDFTFQGIKIGLISSVDHLEPIAQILRENSHLPRVIDPVFRSSSGKEFFPQHYLPDYVKKILPLSSLITPNLQEAEFLSGMAITTVKDLKKAAQRISNLTRGACLIKGGHLPGTPTDILVDKGKVYCFSHRKISFSVHGTGCLLSSAILALLAQKKPLFEAVSQAINFTHQQITAAVQLGEGQRLFILGKKD